MCWMLFEQMGILKIYPRIPICIFPHTSGNGPAKSNSISWFGSSTIGSFPKVL